MRQLVNLQVSLQPSAGKDGLRERTHSAEEQLSRVDNHASRAIRPTASSRQRYAGEEGRTGCLCVVESLLHSKVGHADVGAQLKQTCRNANLQELGVEHALASSLARIGCCVLRKSRGTPAAAIDVLWGDGKQPTDSVLHITDVAASVYYLRLHIQIGRLHLINGSGENLTVLPKRLLRFERSVPKAVGHGENLQLTVEHLKHKILLGCSRNKIGAHSLLAHLSLHEHGLRGALLVGQGSKQIDIHRQLKRQVIGLRPRVVVEFGHGSLRREIERRQIGHLGGLQRSLALLHCDAGRVQIGVVGQHLLDELLQHRVGEKLAPRQLGKRTA